MIIQFPKHRKELFFFENVRPISLIALAVIILSYLFIDPPLAQYFKTISPFLYRTAKDFTDLIDPKYHYILWPSLFFIFGYIAKNELWAKRSLLITISVPLTNLLVELLKRLLGRARPDLLFTEHFYGFTFFSSSNAFYSFPSGHACTIGAICGAFACFYPRYWAQLLAACIILAFSRVMVNAHFLSDVIAGIPIGLLASQWIYKLMKKERFKL